MEYIIIKLKRKHFRKLKNYTDFYMRVGIKKLIKKYDKLNVNDFIVNHKTYNKIYNSIENYLKNYEHLYRNKWHKKEKEYRGNLSKYQRNVLSFDALNFAPKVDTDVPDGVIYFAAKAVGEASQEK